MSDDSKNRVDFDTTGTYCIGIGGCGGNVVDTILLHRETNNDSGDSPNPWNRILDGQAIVNSNSSELAKTYYNSEFEPRTPDELASNYLVEGPGTGAGKDRSFGRDLFENHFESVSSWDDAWGVDLNVDPMRDSQAVWLIHSTSGGTGGGGTPVFARELRETLTEDSSARSKSDRESQENSVFDVTHPVGPPVLDFSILGQAPGKTKPLHSFEELITLSRLSAYSDAIVPLANEQLSQKNVGCEISGLEEWTPSYDTANETIVHFLELFGSGFHGRGTKSTGAIMDINDLLAPIESMAPVEDPPSPIVGASIAKASTEDGWTSDRLDNLLANLDDGKLIDFDESTARGGVFVFFHPTSNTGYLTEVNREESQELVEDFCEFEAEFYTLSTYHTVHSGLDAPWLLALFYNPTISRFEKTLQMVSERDLTGTEIGEELASRWDAIEETLRLDLDFEP